eukprot:15247404-Heterocapsa_arctica.AAC.1
MRRRATPMCQPLASAVVRAVAAGHAACVAGREPVQALLDLRGREEPSSRVLAVAQHGSLL